MNNSGMSNVTTAPPEVTTEAPGGDNASVWLVSIFDAWGILSSLIVVLIIWTKKELRHTYYLWLVSNAVFACFVACAFVTPATIHQELAHRDLPFEYCVIYTLLLRIVHFMIPVSLTMIIIDRIIYIFDPIIYVRKMTGGVILAMIWVPWLLSLVFALCSFLPFRGDIQRKYLVENPEQNHCIIRFGFEYFDTQEEFVVSLYYAVPIFLLVTAMLVLMLVLCQRNHCCINHMDEFDFETDDMRENVCRAVAPISFVTLMYIVLLLPLLVVSFQEVDGLETGKDARLIAIWVFIGFEWVQPLLWMMLLPDLRSSVCLTFCCCCFYEEEDTDDLHLVRAEKRYQ